MILGGIQKKMFIKWAKEKVGYKINYKCRTIQIFFVFKWQFGFNSDTCVLITVLASHGLLCELVYFSNLKFYVSQKTLQYKRVKPQTKIFLNCISINILIYFLISGKWKFSFNSEAEWTYECILLINKINV